MKLILNQLMNSQRVLSTLGNTKGLPSVVAYNIVKNVKHIDEELKLYEETRKKIVEERANKDENGKPIIKDDKYDLTDEALQQVNEEIVKLLNEEVEIDIKKVSINDIDKAGLTPFELATIEFMIETEE